MTSESPKESTEARLVATVAETLEINLDRVQLNQSREALPEWDSLKHLEVMIAVEETFSVRFTSSEIAETRDLMDLYKLVSSKLAE